MTVVALWSLDEQFVRNIGEPGQETYRLKSRWVGVAINVTSMMSPTNVSMASSMQKNERHPFSLLGRLLTAFCAKL
jgi:hypothetical protein